MKIWVGITDGEWFEYLRERSPDEVNFWQPSAGRQFKVLEPGEPFLFKLHSPRNFIVGGGFFVRHTTLPCSLAWAAFGEKNGVADIGQFRARIAKYRRSDRSEPDPMIGCSVMTEPFFWAEEKWIPIPAGWAPNIVQGRGYSTMESSGATLWQDVSLRLVGDSPMREIRDDPPGYGAA